MAPGRFTNCTIPASFAVKKEKIYTNLKNEMMILEPLKKKTISKNDECQIITHPTSSWVHYPKENIILPCNVVTIFITSISQ